MNKKLIGIAGKSKSGKDLLAQIIQYVDGEYYKEYPSFDKWRLNVIVKYDVDNHHYQIKKFASKVKDIASLMTGIPRHRMEDQDVKNKTLGDLTGDPWIRYRCRVEEMFETSIEVETTYLDPLFKTEEEAEEYLDNYYRPAYQVIKEEVIKEDLTLRNLLQFIGTDAFRETIHPDCWVKALFADYNIYDKWIISDTRFPNEADRIKSEGGLLIHIDRPLELRFPELHEQYKKVGQYSSFEKFLLHEYNETYKYIMHTSETALDSYEGFDKRFVNDTNDIEYLIKQIKLIFNK